MLISLIVAMDESRGIGKAGKLPWSLPADLKRFKALTMGHHLIMGRKTYESIGSPLPGRTNLIVTRDPDFWVDGCQIVHSLPEAFNFAAKHEEDQVFVIGGGEIFAQALRLSDRIYLTLVHGRFGCDTLFPELNQDEWELLEQRIHPIDEKNPFALTFSVMVRKITS